MDISILKSIRNINDVYTYDSNYLKNVEITLDNIKNIMWLYMGIYDCIEKLTEQKNMI